MVEKWPQSLRSIRVLSLTKFNLFVRVLRDIHYVLIKIFLYS